MTHLVKMTEFVKQNVGYIIYIGHERLMGVRIICRSIHIEYFVIYRRKQLYY